jgi:ribonuclease HI
MNTIYIYTDGGCRGNGKKNNIGGLGVVFIYDENVIETISAGYRGTTNNIMELTAILRAFYAIPKLKEDGKIPHDLMKIIIYTDSQYAANAFNEHWISNWKRNGWKSAARTPVKNIKIWKELDKFVHAYDVDFVKVAGHSGDVFNEMADNLANEAMDELEDEY